MSSTLFFFPSNYVWLLFDVHRYRFSIGNECWPVDLTAGDHGAISFNAGTYVSSWIPVSSIGKPEGVGYVIDKVIDSFHRRVDILQTLLTLALASPRKPKVEPRDVVVLVL